MNKTECPHCITSFSISDEQLRLSHGKVRCGNCLERFDAYEELVKETPGFDPRSAFIEPLSHYEEEHLKGVDDLVPDSRNVEFQDSALSPVEVGKLKNLSDETSISQDDSAEFSSNLANNLDPELSVHLDDEDFTESLESNLDISKSTKFLEPSTGMAISKKHITEASIQFEEGFYEEPSIQKANSLLDELDVSSENESSQQVFDRVEPSLFNKSSDLKQTEFDLDTTTQTLDNLENSENLEAENLVDVVDQLVEDKILENKETETQKDSDFYKSINASNKKPRRLSRLIAWPLNLVFMVLVALLSVTLIYQLWQKQFISWPDRPEFQDRLTPITQPLLEKLDEQDITIPQRRSLRSLQLISAKSEPHPTRSSTLLLKVNLMNRAEIEQPLPWLELSLNDSEGRTISRRSLSPKDYIHNNRISQNIGPKELKKITIELLSFPKHTAGYELRLLNK